MDAIIACIIFHVFGVMTALGIYFIGRINHVPRWGKWAAIGYLILLVVQDIVHVILWGFGI